MYKVLVVDDERMIRLGIQRVIPWGSLQVDEVFVAGSAGEALELLKAHPIDLLITDISMSEMTGLDLVGKIREQETDMRVIVLTGYDRFDYAQQALKLSVHDFLLKPVDEEELERSIRTQLALLQERRDAVTPSRAEGVRQQYRLNEVMEEIFNGKADSSRVLQLFAEWKTDPHQKMQAGMVMPDRVSEEDEEGRIFRMRNIQNLCMDMLDARHLGITFLDHSGRILLAFFLQEENGDAEELASELAEILQEEYAIRVRLVIGSVVSGVEQLHISWNDAQNSLNNERKEFQDMIIRSRVDRKRADIFQDVFREFKNALAGSVADAEQALHIFGRFRMAVESYNLSARYTQQCCFELAATMAFSCLNDSGNRSEESLNALMKSLNGTSRETACEVTEVFLERLFLMRSGNDHELIRKAKAQIRERLGEDLSVAGLAAELYVTPNYLSRLFKRITGEGCNEYIVRKRIEKAKALLEATTMKIGEIAQTVGYIDMNYFSLAFKKHTGMSPTKYRSARQGGEGKKIG